MPHTPTDAPALREELTKRRNEWQAGSVEDWLCSSLLCAAFNWDSDQWEWAAQSLLARQSGAAGALNAPMFYDVTDVLQKLDALAGFYNGSSKFVADTIDAAKDVIERQRAALAAPSKADVPAVRGTIGHHQSWCYALTGGICNCPLRYATPQQSSQAAGGELVAAWNAVRKEARALAGNRGIGDLLIAVDSYGVACAARPPAPPEGARVPAGWKLVPVEPTQEMVEAGRRALQARFNDPNPNTADFDEVRYSAMLAAAPADEETGK